jgi:fatty acid desaturase
MHGAVAETSGLVQSARKLTRHLEEPRPTVYWADFLSAHLLGCAAFYFAAAPLLSWPLRGVAFALCVLLWYRSITFIHELAHFRPGRMGAFVQTWNLLAGIPLLCPSFLYSAHLQHHARSQYATRKDGEYTPWGVAHPGNILAFPVSSAGAPVLALLRFGFLAPATWIVPTLRMWVYQRASALVVHGSHRRSFPGGQDLRNWHIQEAVTFLWIGLVAASAVSGHLSWRWPLVLIASLATISFINSIRTLAAHRFRNTGSAMTYLEQIQDSVNHPEGGLLTELLCPVGLRYHSLHHMLPSLPYHSLPQAHRILMRELPDNSPYRQTNSSGICATIAQLVRDARRASALKPRQP